MHFRAESIEIRKGRRQPIQDALEVLKDAETPEGEFWRVMSYLQNLAFQTNDGHLIRLLDRIMQLRKGHPFPRAVVTTPQNLPPREKAVALNLNAPRINLRNMLEGSWLAACCSDGERFGKEWTEGFVNALMREYGEYLAKEWPKRPLVVKGQVAGALLQAGVLKGSRLAIARAFFREENNTKEVKTFAKYMGQIHREPYVEWVKTFAEKG